MSRDGRPAQYRITSRVYSKNADSTIPGELNAKGFKKTWMNSNLPWVRSGRGSYASFQQTEELFLQHLWLALLWFINIHCPSLGKADRSDKYLWLRLSCVLWGASQHPWTLPTRYQEHFPPNNQTVLTTKLVKCPQVGKTVLASEPQMQTLKGYNFFKKQFSEPSHGLIAFIHFSNVDCYLYIDVGKYVNIMFWHFAECLFREYFIG